MKIFCFQAFSKTLYKEKNSILQVSFSKKYFSIFQDTKSTKRSWIPNFHYFIERALYTFSVQISSPIPHFFLYFPNSSFRDIFFRTFLITDLNYQSYKRIKMLSNSLFIHKKWPLKNEISQGKRVHWQIDGIPFFFQYPQM